MAGLYVLGARQRKLFLKAQEEWNLYESALILRLDTETGDVETCVEYKSPPEARPNDLSSNSFKAATLVGDLLYTCTYTEVIIYRVPSFERVAYISLPLFNDLHHVMPSSDGNLLVASTGLDMVIKLTTDGTVIDYWSVVGEDPWSRFSRTADYRKVESTKPHKAHPNFVFELDGKVWATRLRQRDAICLEDPTKRIDIAVMSPHDGVQWGRSIYFTTVDGRIVLANPSTLKVEEIVDLKEIDGKESLLGWCRSLMPISETRLWVGFSRVRKTNIKENILWVKNIFREGMNIKPTHISLYDIAQRKCLKEFDLERHGMNIVFGIFPADAALKKNTVERDEVKKELLATNS